MIDAKRLAELMEPEKLRNFAAFFDDWRRTWLVPSRASKQDTVPTVCLTALEDAAAVLREMAGQAGTDKVIEVDLADPEECIFCDYEQGFCHADGDSANGPRSCVHGSTGGGKNAHAPEWCPARGRVIVKASSLAENGHAPKVAEQRGISDLVEIGRRHFVKGCTGADPALMAIHDAAPDEKTANKAYTELMSVLAAEVRFDAEDKETRRRAEIDAGKE